MSVTEYTPVLVGVGQFVERIDAVDYKGLSAVQIAAEAARAALHDALSVEALVSEIDDIATTRTFEDSMPVPPVFGKTRNFPRAVAKSIGASPRHALWAKAGGNSPQRLVNEAMERLASGASKLVLIAGAEAISSARYLSKQGQTRDWRDDTGGSVIDEGWGLKGMVSQYTRAHGLLSAATSYALFENARRTRLGLTPEQYALEMGRLFAPFTHVAASNPYASTQQTARSPEELVTVDAQNRMIASPYPQRVIARDQVNQGAALLLTTVGHASALGIPEGKWVYLHSYCDLSEQDILDREDLSQSPAARLASDAALTAAGISSADIRFFDFYSCFPIPVFNVAVDHFGLSPEDPRGLTVTGGLPYFGGPGNNYSMHAIAGMAERLRANPQTYGFVGANGGVMSKYSAGVYSTTPKSWKPCDSTVHQARIDSLPAPTLASRPNGPARVETFTVSYEGGIPKLGIVVGRLEDGSRFLANTLDQDRSTLQAMVNEDFVGKKIFVQSTPRGNKFTLSAESLAHHLPKKEIGFRDGYEYCLVERRGRVLEVTINRPDSRNCLHPMANEELDGIFDAFESDDTLWLAIITGAGQAAFSAGNDLKYTASGKPMWTPANGFAGLTARPSRKKPVIAAVNGFAMGGGLEIALACDIVVADANAQFALSETRVGLFAGAGGLVRLPRQIPRKVATELILTGRKFGAEQAMAYGLISSIAPAGQALEAARTLAAEITDASPTSVRLSLQVMREAEKYPAPVDALKSNEVAVDELLCSEDMIEGLTAFAQKRKPEWKNR